MSKMIVVSNAEPYKHVDDGNGRIECVPVEGGLTTAMNPHMKKTSGVWIAYGRGEKDFEVVDEEKEVMVPPSADSSERYTLKRLDFPSQSYRNFYRGSANRVVWPIFHSFPTKANLRKEPEYWEEGYLPCNEKYAEVVSEVYQPGDTVWVHDYHLALVPKLVREKYPEAKIGVFWHIPWPPWENFAKIPHAEEILKGLSAADLVGLQIERYVKRLLECAEWANFGVDGDKNFEVDRDKGRYEVGDSKTEVFADPLGVDFDFFNDQEVGEEAEKIREEYEVDQLILGVDRQDYTKGIPERIRAFEKFIEENQEYQEHISLIQRTPSSRRGIAQYQQEREEINHKVSEFNGRFGTHDWRPITLFWKGVPQKELIAEYRAADIGLVTPGLDGMNLVAKEFVAANSEPKVLILSKFAGAAEQLEQALIVNPYDKKEVANSILRAIEMPAQEKRERWKALRKTVREEDLPAWASRFRKRLEKAHNEFH